ncbi:MAG: hypothetical protein HY775_04020 [Acidobacteria bacterium]|nr:hypothetical protein [Acidobacteriota bacterium]
MDARFGHQTYTVRRKVLKLVGGAFHVFDPAGNVVFYSRMKAFKLREDIRLYTGEDMQTEVLRIGTRQILDFAAAYDVIDSQTGEKVGALKRKGLKSLVRDHWIVMDAADREVGAVLEDSVGLAVLRRLLGLWASLVAPQRYHVEIGSRAVGTGVQNRNPFVYKVTLDFSPDTGGVLDRRLGLAAGILLAAIEGKQG